MATRNEAIRWRYDVARPKPESIGPVRCVPERTHRPVAAPGEWNNARRSDRDPDEGRTTYTANVLAPEDIALCESVQRGLKSKGYDQGPIMAGATPAGENEFAIHHFHKLVHEALDGHG